MQKLKRVTYMVLSLITGVLISELVTGFLEMVYLKNILKAGGIPIVHQFLGMQLFLQPWIFVLIFASGIAFGTWLGFYGWRVVYVEHRRK